MKNIKYIMLALLCGLFTGCMDGDWDTPSGGHTRGNAQIKEKNVQTIAQLKAKYASTLASAYGYTQVTDDEQIKAVVTGNDIEGNLFGQISVDDGTGAMLIAISEGGINGYLPVGTEILISLKDLYIGNYGYQPQIGTLYESAKGQTSVSRMARMRWDQQIMPIKRMLSTITAVNVRSKASMPIILSYEQAPMQTLLPTPYLLVR